MLRALRTVDLRSGIAPFINPPSDVDYLVGWCCSQQVAKEVEMGEFVRGGNGNTLRFRVWCSNIICGLRH